MVPNFSAAFSMLATALLAVASGDGASLGADDAAEQRANGTFRRDLAVGIETNCGTVIQIREPMVEIAVPPIRLTPN